MHCKWKHRVPSTGALLTSQLWWKWVLASVHVAPPTGSRLASQGLMEGAQIFVIRDLSLFYGLCGGEGILLKCLDLVLEWQV